MSEQHADPPASTASPARRRLPGPEPLAFHRLGRLPGVRRRRVVGAVALGLAVYLGVVVLGIGLLLLLQEVGGVDVSARMDVLDLGDPLTFVLAYLSIAVLLPVVLLVRRWTGLRPVGLVSSVAGRLRWRWLARALAVAGVVYALSFGLQLVADAVLGPGPGAPVPVPGAWVFLLAAVLLVPLQSAAEEYVFRGVLMQTVGSWLRHPAFAVLLPVPLFVLGHGYDVWGQLDIGFFAVLAGWITWRTGGLEAAIALHVVNNSLLTVLMSFGWVDPNATEGSPLALALSVLTTGVAAALLVRSADRSGVERVRPLPIRSAAAAVGPAVPR